MEQTKGVESLGFDEENLTQLVSDLKKNFSRCMDCLEMISIRLELMGDEIFWTQSQVRLLGNERVELKCYELDAIREITVDMIRKIMNSLSFLLPGNKECKQGLEDAIHTYRDELKKGSFEEDNHLVLECEHLLSEYQRLNDTAYRIYELTFFRNDESCESDGCDERFEQMRGMLLSFNEVAIPCI